MAKALGKDLGSGDPAAVMAEIASLAPRYQAVSYATLTVKGHLLSEAGDREAPGADRRGPLLSPAG